MHPPCKPHTQTQTCGPPCLPQIDTYTLRVLQCLETAPHVSDVELSADGKWRPAGVEGPWVSIHQDPATISIAPPVPVKAEPSGREQGGSWGVLSLRGGGGGLPAGLMGGRAVSVTAVGRRLVPCVLVGSAARLGTEGGGEVGRTEHQVRGDVRCVTCRLKKVGEALFQDLLVAGLGRKKGGEDNVGNTH